jgi:hypothetical protein
MRKLVFVLIAFMAVVTFIRAFEHESPAVVSAQALDYIEE